MIDNVNFKGSFLIKQPAAAELKNKLLPKDSPSAILGARKQIIENLSDKGDVLYVVRDFFDKNVADILLAAKNVKFRYYPTLNTKSGFDGEKPQEVKKILRSAASKFIDTKQKLETFFKQKTQKTVDIVSIQAKNLQAIEDKTFIKTTGDNCVTNIDRQNGICSVYKMIDVKDIKTGKKRKVRHTLISITSPNKKGVSYAVVNPLLQKEDDKMRKLVIKNGKVIFEYNEPWSKDFVKNYKAAKQYYIDTLKKKKDNGAILDSVFA